MFTHNINPVLLDIYPFEIRYYGLVFAIGFLLVYFALNKKKKGLKLEKQDIESFMLYMIIGTVIGARLFHVLFWDPVYYFQFPLKIFALWEGGMALHGGIIGVSAAVYCFCRKNKLSFLKLADIISIPALFAMALGRIANFINAEIIGTMTDVRWCVKFPGIQGCRHPVQLYGAIGRFLLMGYLIALKEMKRFKDGFLFWNMLFFLGAGRFIIDFLREDTRFLGLSLGQYLSLLMALIAGYIIWKEYRRAF